MQAKQKTQEATTNVIKVVVFLIEEATIAEYIDKITSQIPSLDNQSTSLQDTNEATAKLNKTHTPHSRHNTSLTGYTGT